MLIVPEILKKVELAGARVVAVTKYFSPEDTAKIVQQLEKKSAFWACGENRIADIREKNTSRKNLHFIGNIQSRDIPEIAERCSVVHSLCSEKHARLLAEQPQKPSVFIQVNISGEPQKHGIMPDALGAFLEMIQNVNLTIEGISALGAGEFDEDQKRKEFQRLRELRDRFLPEKKISAGTSRDFEIALEEGIGVVRIGQALFGMTVLSRKNLKLS